MMPATQRGEAPGESISFVITGAPRTKKNHGWRTIAGHQMPSRAFAEWNRAAQRQMIGMARYAQLHGWNNNVPVNCTALFYRDAERGDAVGYYQALADALEDAQIVKDDRLIVSWDGSRMLKDSVSPRIKVSLQPAELAPVYLGFAAVSLELP
jgi:Holliday junction resolvase RusA-like endonuclease